MIETKEGENILVDSGGTVSFSQADWRHQKDAFEVGKDILVPFLRYRGIHQIDTFIMTHGDLDHIGGFQAVLSRFPVGQVIRNSHPIQSSFERNLMARLQKMEIPIYTVPSGTHGELVKGMEIFFIHPDHATMDNSNSASLVFLLSIDQTEFLLTGDIEEEIEHQILDRWNLPEIEFVKIAHHGSDTSSSKRWIGQLRPRHAIISVGEKNRYGHPSAIVLQRLLQKGVRIWRTDQDGAITIMIDENGYRIKSQRREKE